MATGEAVARRKAGSVHQRHGSLHLHLRDGDIDVNAGQAVSVRSGEWIRYSTPSPEGAEYIAVCLPAFSPETVRRDEG